MKFITPKKAPILLVGDGRSGTTWVSHIINYKNEMRYLFEPFHLSHVEAFKTDNYSYKYLRPDSVVPNILEAVSKTLKGQVEHPWIDQHNKCVNYDQIFIKDVSCQLFLKWIKTYFPETKIIYLLRHPFATVVSKMQVYEELDWGFPENPGEFLADTVLFNDHLRPFATFLENSPDYFYKLLLMWCVLSLIPLIQFEHGEIHLAFYEEFCEDPSREIKRMFDFLGESLDEDRVPETFNKVLKQPSETSQIKSAINTNSNLISGWKEILTPEQVEKGLEIIKAFGLDKIYSAQLRPNINEAYRFLESSKDHNNYNVKVIEIQKSFAAFMTGQTEQNLTQLAKLEDELEQSNSRIEELQKEIKDNKIAISELHWQLEHDKLEFQKLSVWAVELEKKALSKTNFYAGAKNRLKTFLKEPKHRRI